MVTGKQAVPVKTRNRRSKVAEPQEDSQNPESSKIKPSSLFKEMNISIEKRRNGKRQELRRHHKLQAKKAEERIREAFRVDKSAFDEYRSSRARKLSELVKKRSELEVKIVTLLQSVKATYEATNNDISATLGEKLANLH